MKVESLRAAIEAEVTAYALNHYRHGVSATFSKPTEVAYKKKLLLIMVMSH